MKKCIFIFTFVFTLLLSCSGELVAYAYEYDKTQDYLSLVEGYTTEEIYNFMIEYLETKGYVPDSYPYVLMIDCAEYNEKNNVYNPSYYLFLSMEPAVSQSNGVFIQAGNECIQMCIYSSAGDGMIMHRRFHDVSVSIGWLSNVVYSNYEVYDADNNLIISKVSFPRPQMILGIQEPVLTQAITQKNPLMEILTLLPMVMVCLVGYAALRKGFQILVRILRQA